MAVGFVRSLERKHMQELAGTVHVSVDSYEDGLAKGVVRSMLDKKPVPFSGLDHLILILCGLAAGGALPEHFEIGPMTWEPVNFLIRVYSRAWNDIQGEIRVGEERCCFKSSSELIWLLHRWLRERHTGHPIRSVPGKNRYAIYEREDERVWEEKA
ncbi:MAG: hypothetical protein ACI39W_09335 [Brotaphodocola sp.]